MKHSMQISESIGLGTILALSGGFMDAYSYIERGKVFANAQTGNMLLFGVNLSEGNYQTMLNYLFPVLAFALGIALADTVRTKEPNLLHWRQISVLTETLILIAVSFLSSMTANPPSTFFSCAFSNVLAANTAPAEKKARRALSTCSGETPVTFSAANGFCTSL